MTKLLEQAFEAASKLSDDEQDRAGRELMAYLEQRRAFRADIKDGMHFVDAGNGRELDVDELIARVLKWAPERQVDVARIVEIMEKQDGSDLRLSDEDSAEVRRRLATPSPRNIPAEVVFKRFR